MVVWKSAMFPCVSLGHLGVVATLGHSDYSLHSLPIIPNMRIGLKETLIHISRGRVRHFKGSNAYPFHIFLYAMEDGNWKTTWRIIPISKWLVTPIYKPFSPFGRGITLLRGLTIHGY